MRELITTLQAPRAEMQKFDGNPLHYMKFVRLFEDSVEKALPDPTARLVRLTQLCTGEAARVIDCCQLMPPDVGYTRARQLLAERFGSSYTITNLWVHKLVSERKSGSLREYAYDLRCCLETLSAVGTMEEMNNMTNLKKVIDNLPNYLQNRWRGQNQKILKGCIKQMLVNLLL